MTRRPSRRTATALVAVVAAATVSPGVGAASASSPAGVDAASYAPPEHLSQWWYDAMELAELQRRTDGGKGVTIAVFDGYLDTSVPDLKGADVTIKPGCNEDETPRDMGEEADHGTAMVTALVGQGTGNGPGGRGVLGVVPNATVNFYSMNRVHDDGKPDCDTYFFGKMIERAVADGADVITTQVTGGLVGGVEKEIDAAMDAGAVVVSSSGNANTLTGLVEPPASILGVVAVGAADQQFQPWADNPRSVESGVADNANIDFSAPGVETPLGGFVDGAWVSGATRTGTSGAAAIAAGAFALAKAGAPEATGNQLVQAAVRTARDEGISWDPEIGFGAVRVAKMIDSDPAGWPDDNPLLLKPSEVESSLSPDDRADEGSDDGDAAAEESAAPSAQAEQEPAASRAGEEAGPPVGALALGGALGLAVLVGAVVLARRRSRSTT